MASWAAAVVRKVRAFAAQRNVRFTRKAFRELGRLEVGIDEDDACYVLSKLVRSDLVCRIMSDKTGEWMYVFKPRLGEIVVWVKVILRSNCVVISFHDDENQGNEEE
jgi:MqsR (Motility quorum-sensing regulator) toxin of toxin-antitoxin system